jgi:two-component system cell cycle sensor histidine kinase/response regulator CckA
MQPKVLRIGDLLTDWSMLVNRLLGEKIELKILSVRDLWHVKADPSELERIIINLAVNARDAMLPKGGRLTIRTRNVTERDSQKLAGQGVAKGEYVLIEVEDNGSGMTPEVMAKIFDPFFTTKAVGKGTGLGLASVYGIVQQTGGYIFPESTLGEGTTFRLYLPRYFVEPEEEAEMAPAAIKKPRQRDLTGTGRVLLVEDEDAVRRFAVAHRLDLFLGLDGKGQRLVRLGAMPRGWRRGSCSLRPRVEQPGLLGDYAG